MGPLTAIAEVDQEALLNVLSMGGTFTLIEDAVQNLESVQFDDDEIEALLSLPEEIRLRCIARLVELVDLGREALRDLDGRLLQLGVTAEG